jgi:hypothetical protein
MRPKFGHAKAAKGLLRLQSFHLPFVVICLAAVYGVKDAKDKESPAIRPTEKHEIKKTSQE